MKLKQKLYSSSFGRKLPTSSIGRCLALLLVILIGGNVRAQTFLWDHMSTYSTNTSLINHAIHKDPANNVYYIVQSLPSEGYSMLISVVDQDYNITATYRYSCTLGAGAAAYNEDMYIYPEDINFFDNQLIVVGRYIEEGVDYGGFMFSANRTTGAFQWFQKYTDVYTLNSVVCNSNIGGSIAVGWREHAPGWWNPTSGVIMRMDATGNVMWFNDVDDDKYNGTGIAPIYNKMHHVIQISSQPDMFAAVGSVNNFLNFTFEYSDGDGALVVFDDQGNISTQYGLGNATPMSVNPGPQNIQHDFMGSIALCSDGDVVIAGYVLELPDTYLSVNCTTSTPDYAGLWVTKLNPYTGMVAWSKVYDWYQGAYSPPYYPIIADVDIINDGTDNFGVEYYDYADVVSIMKVDANGNQVYSRRYIHPSGNGYLRDISSGMLNTDILTTGSLNNGDSWNVTAFDNISGTCHAEDLPLDEYEHPYDIFPIDIFGNSTTPTGVSFQDRLKAIVHTLECEKIEDEGDGSDDVGKNAPRNITAQISQELQTGDILVKVSGTETYNGKLMNSVGQVISTYSGITNVYHINTDNLASGMYFMHLDNGKEKIVKHISVY